MIAKKLTKIAGIGKGQPGPLSNVPRETREQEGDKRYMDAGVSVDLPLPIVMKLDPQGPLSPMLRLPLDHPRGKVLPRTPHVCVMSE